MLPAHTLFLFNLIIAVFVGTSKKSEETLGKAF
jgi:hypothetical protein